jgi:hypothetical protein
MTLGARLRDGLRHPFAGPLALAFVLRLWGVGFGLPSTDGWDDDGVAPRDFLAGLYQTYDPGGDFYVYPPVHLVLLALANLPTVIVAASSAPSLTPQSLVAHFLQPQFMTPMALVSRVVSVVLSLVTIVAIARIVELGSGRRAATLTAWVLAVNATATYYAHTTNLESAYLCWASLGLLSLARLFVTHDARHVVRMLTFTCLAVGTKDQAYALFVLGVPLAVAIWFASDRRARSDATRMAKALARATAFAFPAMLVIEGAATNPHGFAKRLAFLVGPGSRDHAYYTEDAEGRLAILRDAASYFDRYYHPSLALPLAVGLVLTVMRVFRERSSGRAAVHALPPLAALSFLLTFNFAAGRTEHRFLLPQSLMLATTIGIGLDAIVAFVANASTASIGRLAVGLLLVPSAHRAVAVDVELAHDPRYAVEQWLAVHIAHGDRVEVHGNNVYLPRIPNAAHTQRVDPRPVRGRSPIPGAEEVEGRFEDMETRAPRWVVVSQAFAWRYLGTTAEGEGGGHAIARGQRAFDADRAPRAFFQDLYADRVPHYRTAFVARWRSRWWPRFEFHCSTGQEVRVFERID